MGAELIRAKSYSESRANLSQDINLSQDTQS